MEVVLVSACLLGLPTRYDGRAKPSEAVGEALAGGVPVPVCPEQLGGLPTPRSPCEISNGDGHDVLDGRARVVSDDGRDCTGQYVRGAEVVLRMAQMVGAHRAVLKQRSPACGCGAIVRNGVAVDGDGVCAALLRRNGLDVVAL